LAYLFGIVGGLVIYLIESKNKFVRFNAMQSILLFAAFMVAWIALIVLSFLPYVGCLTSIVSFVVWIGYIVLTIMLMIKSYGGDKVKLPIIGDIAERQA
jgi:uncharacterized membrane protein